MRTRSRLFSLGVVTTSLCLLAITAVSAQAQGRYRGERYTKADVDRIIKRVEDRSDSFKKLVDRSLDHGRLDGTDAEDRINEQVKDLEKALDELRHEFDRTDTWRETRRHVEKVLREAEEVNYIFNHRNLRPDVERQWGLLRADINKLAGIYDLPHLRA
ncbi:MAG TPA: hypothetical protein VFV34_26820 [Blastocatellia bacterium]|nr:hypothetical protein [Blastocatellia bacterium]